MKKVFSLTILLIATGAMAAAQNNNPPNNYHLGAGASNPSDLSNLPVGKIGNDDLLGITVYDSPELTRTVRVNSEGDIRLPMVKQLIHASGLFPSELEKAVSTQLVTEKVLVDPIVTVSIVEYRSRPITVVGAVKTPLKFQATGVVTLLDAISTAGGLAENAGAEVLVTGNGAKGSNGLVQRISLRNLINGSDPSLNLRLEGGEEVRVPMAGRVYVVGNVKKPGAFSITEGNETSVMKAIAFSEGLDSYTAHKAYIYRVATDGGGRSEIPVELKQIMNRKNPDVALLDNDILYIPRAGGVAAGARAAQVAIGAGVALGAAALYVMH